MGRRRGVKKTYYYCPGCNKKKLWAIIVTDLTLISGSRRVWRCDHCSNEISVPDRDAEITDHGTVLDRMVSGEPPVVSYILSHYHHVRRPGLKVLFTGNHLDVVRLTDNYGTGIYTIFHFDQEGDHELRKLLAGGPSRYVKFRNTEFRRIFWQSRFCLFHKNMSAESFDGPLFSDKEESSYLIAMITDWAETFDRHFPALVEEMRTKSKIWFEKQREMVKAIEKLSNGVLTVESYDHIADVVSFRTAPSTTSAELLAMAEALNKVRQKKAQDGASG